MPPDKCSLRITGFKNFGKKDKLHQSQEKNALQSAGAERKRSRKDYLYGKEVPSHEIRSGRRCTAPLHTTEIKPKTNYLL